MCGLNGIFAFNSSADAPERAELIATRERMRSRGPDGAGEWWNADRRVGLAHRRLSIIDLSHAADQPMTDGDDRFTIVFNGEIYNYEELRRDLERNGVRFRTRSDTEVLLHLYAKHGTAMLHTIRGMYALAIWDELERRLFLARDPYGIKPLYTANDGWTFRFASQVKALLAGGAVSRDPEPAGVVGFYLWGCVPEPFTLFQSIRELPAGHFQMVDDTGAHEPRSYAHVPGVLAAGVQNPAPALEAPHRIREAVLDSVRAHLVADVEVGLFLSAGIDSGALLALMVDAGRPNTRAITLAFDEFRGTSEDESQLAAMLANRYGASHVIRHVSKREFDADIDSILDAMDQPSIDGINTWFVAKAAREAGLKVAISGVGGDELLAGYPSFTDLPRWVRLLKAPSLVPGLGRLARGIAGALGIAAQTPKLRSLLEYGGSYAGAYLLRRGVFLPHELSDILDEGLAREGIRRLKVLRSVRKTSLTPDPGVAISRVSSLESTQYLRNMLLRDADWAGMAHSLEIRTPLVDFSLLKALAPVTPGLPLGIGKRTLARTPSTTLPHAITEREKTGFGVPIGKWIADAARADMTRKGVAARAWTRHIHRQFASSTESVAAATPLQPNE